MYKLMYITVNMCLVRRK